MLNSVPSVQTPTMMPGATDEASKIVGYNIDNYVFGGDSFTPQNPNATVQQTSGKNTTKNTLLGVLSLGGILAAGIALAKGIFKK